MRDHARLLRNRALLRSLGSFGFAFTAEWAFVVALGLVAFADGGATAVGLVGLLRLLPAGLLAPVIAVYGDRLPRERVLIASSGVRGVATLTAGIALVGDGPIWVVYACAVVSTVAFTPYRASHSALMPSLCRTPDELTSVNVARGALDSLSVVIGPFVAAALLATADVAAVFVFAGACGLVSALLLVRLDYARIPIAATDRRLGSELREGIVAVGRNRGVTTVVAFVCLQAALRGAFTVLVIVVAIDLLHEPEASVGVIQGAVGIGALVGSLLSTLLVGSRAMARWLGIAVVLWGAPLAAIGLLPHYAVALLAAGVIGIGNAFVDVTAFTLIARMTPNAVLARVFGVLESAGAFAVALGSLAAPALVVLLDPRGALWVAGALAPIACLLWWRVLTGLDRSVAVRTDAIDVLRRVPMLRPLPVPVVEQLAQGLERVSLGPGETVFEAGQTGHDFYVVVQGTVGVHDRGREVRTMGPGEGFGEIALLADTPRTMTVRTDSAVELYLISRALFLPAVTGMSEARAAAEAARATYLDDDADRSLPDPG